jgi:hypothetical protein
VGLGLEIELWRLAHAADLDVLGLIPAHRHGFVRDVGDARQELTEFVVEGFT